MVARRSKAHSDLSLWTPSPAHSRACVCDWTRGSPQLPWVVCGSGREKDRDEACGWVSEHQLKGRGDIPA